MARRISARRALRVRSVATAAGVACLVLLASTPATAQQTDIAKGFAAPPDTARPLTWWHWVSGNVTREGLEADLLAMKQIGLGGAQIFSVNQGPAGPVVYMSPQWRALVQDAIRKAHVLGLKLSITDCEGWSESGGPWITPELSMQTVAWTETTVQGSGGGGTGGATRLAVPAHYQDYYRDIAVLAFPTPAGDARIANIAAKAGFTSDAGAIAAPDPVVTPDMAIDPTTIQDVTSRLGADGTLSWSPPAGSWTVLRMGTTSTGTPIHPAMPETSGLECDKLSPAAVTANWNGALAHVIADSGGEAGRTLGTILMDSWEAGTGNWTPLMRQDFQSRRGYDPLLWLPALTGRIVGSTDQTERFLWDYRRTMADLVAENHYGLIRRLAHQHGMVLEAEAVGIGLPTVADELLCKGNTDIPMGEYWIGNPWSLSDDKEAASAAHIYGKTLAGAESFTSTPEVASWTNDPFSIKALGDDAFCIGINRYSFHRYAMQPYLNRAPGMTMGPWGLNFERTNTWWGPGKAWIAYITGCQYLLQQGLFVGDLCYFYGEGAPRDVGGFRLDPAPPAGYDYDVCNADVILHRMSVKNGRIVLPDGMSYGVLVLPNDARLTPEVAAKIRDLVAAGATVVGPKPNASPSLSRYPDADTAVQEVATQVWADCDGTHVTRHTYGKGQIVWGEPLDRVLAPLGPDFTYTSESKGARIKYIHRRAGDLDYYFVSNQNYAPVDVACTFRVANAAPELWWPDTGKIERAAFYGAEPTGMTVPLHLDSAGSVFVVFRRSAPPALHVIAVIAGDAAPLLPAPQPHVHILSARYGVMTQVDVTLQVRRWQSVGEPQLVVGNDLSGADPDPNVVKKLVVDYTVGGTPHTAEIGEGGRLMLPDAPAGTADVVIVKAMYGVPGVVVDTTRQVAALAADGILTIPASNDINGGVDPVPNVVKTLETVYTVDGVLYEKRASEGSSITLADTILDTPPSFELAYGADHRPGIRVWNNVNYSVELSSKATREFRVTDVPAPVALKALWALSFPAGWGAPPHVTVASLKSWTGMADDGVRHFSGTATYTTRFTVRPAQLGSGKALYLDLGIVKNLAEVTVNGHDLGVLWKAPFRIEITRAAVVGTNALQVQVTNLWPNRLIGDAGLPPAKRYTWTTFNPYTPASGLLASGLIGPVVLRSSVWKGL
jgi:hypothetical protein